MAIEKGTVLDGKYEIVRQIGKGGMSVVYLAMDNRLNKQWAIKVVQRQGRGKNNELIINKATDAEVMKNLDHPAIPRVFDIIDRPEDPQIYIIMDYIEGEDLSYIVKEFGAQPEDLVVEWGKQLCDVLIYLHSQKPPIIYRDMKPSNVRLKPEGNLKVYDFGISRKYKEQSLADTNVLGTKGYAPPEQYGSSQTDARSDIYSLGMTLHHLVTGADPRADDYVKYPIREYNPELSEGLEYIIEKCTKYEPGDRYQTASELMYDLDHIKEIGRDFKNQQKKKLSVFIIAMCVSLLFLLVGIGGRLMVGRQYDTLLAETGTIDDYYRAIEIAPDNPRAYISVINYYEQSETFSDSEVNRLMTQYNANKDDFAKNSDYYELNYKIGEVYFYYYNSNQNKDNTFRARLNGAGPYFKTIVNDANNGNAAAQSIEGFELARNYYIIYDFYKRCVVKTTNEDLTKADYDELIASFNKCLDELSSNKTISDNKKMVIYQEIFNFPNTYRKSMANCKVSKSDVLNLFEKAYRLGTNAGPTFDEELGIIDYMNEKYESFKAGIEDVYSSVEERSGLSG